MRRSRSRERGASGRFEDGARYGGSSQRPPHTSPPGGGGGQFGSARGGQGWGYSDPHNSRGGNRNNSSHGGNWNVGPVGGMWNSSSQREHRESMRGGQWDYNSSHEAHLGDTNSTKNWSGDGGSYDQGRGFQGGQWDGDGSRGNRGPPRRERNEFSRSEMQRSDKEDSRGASSTDVATVISGENEKGNKEEDVLLEEEDIELSLKETEEERCARVLRESRARREAILQKRGGAPESILPPPLTLPTPPPNALMLSSCLPDQSTSQSQSVAGTTGFLGIANSTVAASSAVAPAAAASVSLDTPNMFDWENEDDAWIQVAAAAANKKNGAEGADIVGGGNVGDSSDDQGYFRPRVGELLGGRYDVLGVLGRGAFSCVLYCRDIKSAVAAPTGLPSAGHAEDSITVAEAAEGKIVTMAAPLSHGISGALIRTHAALEVGSTTHCAIKVVNNRDVMRKAGEREVETLRQLVTSDPRGRYHTVKLIHVFEHVGHLCLAFEPLAANLKEVQDKFGKGVGVPLGAVRVYAAQLLLSLGLLGKLGIVHGDIKPQNIFASEDYRTLKLGDFGSAWRWEVDSEASQPAPYVGSRFYRAPEAIMGARSTPAMDMWSTACVLYELYTGTPLFCGRDNNDMLWLQQSLRGGFPHKMIRKHCTLASTEGGGVELHFDPQSLSFRRRVADPVTHLPCIKNIDFTTPTESLGSRLLSSRAGDSKKTVAAFQNLLESMLTLDPARRCSVTDALGHSFVRG